jgi:hypothetical protein
MHAHSLSPGTLGAERANYLVVLRVYVVVLSAHFLARRMREDAFSGKVITGAHAAMQISDCLLLRKQRGPRELATASCVRIQPLGVN